jgi:hypothetical protein
MPDFVRYGHTIIINFVTLTFSIRYKTDLASPVQPENHVR